MTSTAKTIQYSGKQKLHDIVTFHGSGEDGVFYQESLVPFFLMRMTVDIVHAAGNKRRGRSYAVQEFLRSRAGRTVVACL